MSDDGLLPDRLHPTQTPNPLLSLCNPSLALILIVLLSRSLSPSLLFQTLAVLNPLRGTDQQILQDTDMAGPLVFCLTLGGFLLLVSLTEMNTTSLYFKCG